MGWKVSAGLAMMATIAMPVAGIAAPTVTTIYDFRILTGIGEEPFHGLIGGPSGELYGMTLEGGSRFWKFGVVFELVPPAAGGTTWTPKLLYEFHAGVSATGLTRGADGALYLSTFGGENKDDVEGEIIKLTPTGGDAEWTAQTLHAFNGGINGGMPGPVSIGPNGTLYGVATHGHDSACSKAPAAADSCGEVFALTPPAAGKTNWTTDVLYRFHGHDGVAPLGRVAIGGSGSIYGTTGSLAPYLGSVFKLTPPRAGLTQWSLKTLYQFNEAADGPSPYPMGVALSPNGYLYGTTLEGGAHREGTMYRVLPPAPGKIYWTKQNLYVSNTTNQGFWDGPSLDGAGNVYAAAYSAVGGIVKLSPPSPGTDTWHMTQLETGNVPVGPVVIGPSGTVYAELETGGSGGHGSIVAITP
jgi:hypothetical protein